jgi:TolB-like protein/Tfp pilus assembly protein PilF
LIGRPGEVVTREELQKRLWPDDVTIDFDRGINKSINRIREALGDDAETPRFIETLPQRGYRFMVPLDTDPPDPLPAAAIPSQKRRVWLAAAAISVAATLVAAGSYALHSAPARIESIAVLPLENLSGDPAREYFSDGMTDALIGEIARIGSLRVISRTSIMHYKGAERKTVPVIARELNVDAILEGTVIQSGQRVRITAQLIRAQDDRHLWSEQYERDLNDILALQGEVARDIAGQIQVKLTPGEQLRFAQPRQVNPEAYEAYLRGLFYLQRGIPGVAKSVEFLERSIQIDPSQAEPHASLAEALCYSAIFGLRPSAESFLEAKKAALKALELDSSSASAHNVLANVKDGYEWDAAGARAEYQRALQLNPSHLLTRLWYAEHLTRTGEFNSAMAESDRAIALDPVSALALNNRAMLFFRARRYDDAIRTGQQTLDLDPSLINAFWWQGMSYAGQRNFSKAIERLSKGVSVDDGPTFRALLGHVYGLAGQRTKALAILADLTAMSTRRNVSPMNFVLIYAGLGDANSTFEWLEKSYQVRDNRLSELPSMYFDGVRSDPRYGELLRRAFPLVPTPR